MKKTYQVNASCGGAVEGFSVTVVRSSVARLFQHVQLCQHADVERTLLEGRIVTLITQHHVVHLRGKCVSEILLNRTKTEVRLHIEKFPHKQVKV